MFRVEKRLRHGKVRARLDLGTETFDFVIEIVGDGIHGDTYGEICGTTERFAGPVGSLIEPVQYFDQADGVHFIDAAGFGVIAARRRVSGNRQYVAHATYRPRPEQGGLQADNVLVARGEMRNGFN